MSRPRRIDGRNSNTVAKERYNADNYDAILFRTKKGNKAVITALAEKSGKSISQFVNDILREEIDDFK